MSYEHLLDHFEEPKVPYWAKYHVVIHAEDGAHHKYYQGFAGAEREFTRQISYPPVNYMRDIVGDENVLSTWTLQSEVELRGYFGVVDDWGRRITIEKVRT